MARLSVRGAAEREAADQAGELEQPLHRRAPGQEREVEAVAARVEVPAHDEGDPGRVHEGEPAEVQDEPAEARGPQLLEPLLDLGCGREVQLADGADADDVALWRDVAVEGRR
jgi:hypothetical protein